jgi:hypothetical protein
MHRKSANRRRVCCHRWQSIGALEILTAPLEQQIGVDVVLASNQRNRRARFEGLLRQLSLELHRQIRPLARSAIATSTQYVVHFGAHNVWTDPQKLDG